MLHAFGRPVYSILRKLTWLLYIAWKLHLACASWAATCRCKFVSASVCSHILQLGNMPKKSAKSKSKRTTLKQKYKVIKKVKEHGRKLRKEARKSGKKHKAPADPGLPKQWPFKQELIAELDEKRRLILEAESKKKAERKAARVQTSTQHRMSPHSLHVFHAEMWHFQLLCDCCRTFPCMCAAPVKRITSVPQDAARSEADDHMGEAPTVENLQSEADGKQAAYALAQKRKRKELAATPGQVQGERAIFLCHGHVGRYPLQHNGLHETAHIRVDLWTCCYSFNVTCRALTTRVLQGVCAGGRGSRCNPGGAGRTGPACIPLP